VKDNCGGTREKMLSALFAQRKFVARKLPGACLMRVLDARARATALALDKWARYNFP